MKELLEPEYIRSPDAALESKKRNIFLASERIHIIDLQKTLKMFREASRLRERSFRTRQNSLFVGTKRQAQEAVSEERKKCGACETTAGWAAR